MTLFHYYTYLKSFREIDRAELSASCVYLACKINYKYIKFEEVVNIYENLKKTKKNSDPKIINIEMELLYSLGFDLNIKLPYNYTHLYIKKFNLDKNCEILANNIINDTFRRPLCIFFHPRTITLVSLYLSMNLNYEYNNENKGTNKIVLESNNLENLNQDDRDNIIKNMLNKIDNIKNKNFSNYNDLIEGENDRDKEVFLKYEKDLIIKEFDLCCEYIVDLLESKLKN